MREIFCFFIAIALCLSLCACVGLIDTYADGKLFDDCSVYRHVETNLLYTYFVWWTYCNAQYGWYK